MSNNVNGCSCGNGCCGEEKKKKEIIIDFLYLDLETCQRCQGTDSNLDQAIDEVSTVLNAAGYEVIQNKVNITSPELAEKYRFYSSPTIRINGNDIAMDITETNCTDCGDLCGDSVDCRSWIYEGNEYPEPPKELIINAIMKEIYGVSSNSKQAGQEYALPENLKTFFNGINERNQS